MATGKIAIVLRDDRGLERLKSDVIAALKKIAIVLRDDRGLEPIALKQPTIEIRNCDRSSGRSRIGTYLLRSLA